MCPNLALMLQQRLGAKRSLNIAPLVPFAALCAAFNLLTLEGAWFDERGCLMRLARGAG